MKKADDNKAGWARREFLKTTTGALVVGLGAGRVTIAQDRRNGSVGAWREVGPARSRGGRFLHRGPSQQHRDAICRLRRSRTGRTDRALQIAAEELDLEFSQVLMVDRATRLCPPTASRRPAGPPGSAERRCASAAAEARRVLLEPGVGAAEGAGPGSDRGQGVVSVQDAIRNDPSPTASCWGTNRSTASSRPSPTVTAASNCRARTPDIAPSKSRAAYTIVGTRVPRLDMPDKVSGKYQYMQHVRVPGMLHGRVVWPQGQVAGGVTPPKVVSIDEAVDQDTFRAFGSFAATTSSAWSRNASGTPCARRRQLKVTWEPFPAVFPGHDGIHDSFRAATDQRHRHRRTKADAAGRARAAISGRPRRVRLVPRALRVARDDGAELRGRGRHARRRSRDVLRSGHLSDSAAASGQSPGPARRKDPRAVLRGLEHLRQQLLHRCGGSGGDHVAGSSASRSACS